MILPGQGPQQRLLECITGSEPSAVEGGQGRLKFPQPAPAQAAVVDELKAQVQLVAKSYEARRSTLPSVSFREQVLGPRADRTQ
ncbi:MAG: hypothetical protein ACI8QS_000382 [Planctomycetota bacterium]